MVRKLSTSSLGHLEHFAHQVFAWTAALLLEHVHVWRHLHLDNVLGFLLDGAVRHFKGVIFHKFLNQRSAQATLFLIFRRFFQIGFNLFA